MPLLLQKAKIYQIDPPPTLLQSPITVLFNPSEYVIERTVNYAEHVIQGLDLPIAQFVNGSAERLTKNLLNDTYEEGDVTEYTSRIYALMDVAGDRHAPPLVEFRWGGLSFQGYVVSVRQEFLMFTFTGKPVRARLEVTFQRHISPQDQLTGEPRNSPDRTKYWTVQAGDTLTAIAAQEYGDPELWREIARVNRIDNPRLLKTGQVIKIPAWL